MYSFIFSVFIIIIIIIITIIIILTIITITTTTTTTQMQTNLDNPDKTQIKICCNTQIGYINYIYPSASNSCYRKNERLILLFLDNHRHKFL